MAEVERVRRLEEKVIPRGFDYDNITSFRKEAREKLKRFQPVTLGQASRISGVTPADIAILLVHLEKAKCAKM
jgi:tRNA uridine 5-carboxymethylaminomethyl modification enzyme